MITDEGRRLGRHWDRIDPGELDRYLIQEVEHPAYNPQSVLLRAFMIDRLFPTEADRIIEEELYFSACACFGLLGHREGWFPTLYRKVSSGSPDGELPFFLQSAMRDRLGGRFDLLELYTQIAACLTVGFDDFASPFGPVWRGFLRDKVSTKCRVLELGCGSANDYRFLDSFGVAAHLDYRGVDVSEPNVRNSIARFPSVDFAVGDVGALDADDGEFDTTFAFDLYEHLSAELLAAGLSESLRVTGDELWISLFNAADIPDHEICREGDYYWNLLSIPRLSEEMQKAGFLVEVVSVKNELEARFEDYRHYNDEAHIVIGRRDPT